MLDEKIIEEAKQLIIKQNKEAAAELAQKVISEGGAPLELLNDGFIPGINQVGDLFGRGELFLPELIKAADTMKTVTDIVNEAIAEGMPIYRIDALRCTECVGAEDEPQCIEVCPEDCIIPDPDWPETPEQLQEQYEQLHS